MFRVIECPTAIISPYIERKSILVAAVLLLPFLSRASQVAGRLSL
jgi:hypothetical protein